MSTKKDFGDLKFSLYHAAHEMQMYESYFRNGRWDEGQLVPFHNLELSPAANILNYGQGIFEGMKAYRSARGKIVMFRPMDNARRFRNSCRKMAMAEVTEEKFMDAVRRVVISNRDYVPDSDGGRFSMYIRPVSIGIEPMLGVRAAREYLFYIFASPVGPYFDKVGVVRLVVTDVHRAATHGTGDAKAVCNYPVTMPPREKAIAEGYDGVLFLDCVHDRFVEEAGAANFFALMGDGSLVTPQLGSILPGITRDSIIHLARELYGMKVVERELSIDELCKEARECFLCGTGAIITSVSEIGWKGRNYNVNKNDYQLAHRLYEHLGGMQQQTKEDPFGWVVEIA